MPFSSKKRAKAKLYISSNGTDNRQVLSEILRQTGENLQKKESASISINFLTSCSCQTHYPKKLLERTYDLTVDRLFDLIFGSNDFVRNYRQAQRFYDESASEWMINESTNQQERTLKYKVPYESTFIGKGTIFTREKQSILQKISGSHYVLETEVYNEGVKFCDTFSLILRYCLVQTSLTTTNLRVTAQIIYNKSVNTFIKQIIERNAYSASHEGLKDLNNRLSLITNSFNEQPTTTLTESISSTPIIEHKNSISSSLSSYPTETSSLCQSNDPDRFMHILVFLTIILLCIQMYLYTQLKNTTNFLDEITLILEKQ